MISLPFNRDVPALQVRSIDSALALTLALRNTTDAPLVLAPGEEVELGLTLVDVLELVAELTSALRPDPGTHPLPGAVLDSRPVPPVLPRRSAPLTASRATASGYVKERAR